MQLSLYNTLNRKVEPFIPIEEGKALMYCCGPTVYNYAHIGNLRTYLFEDILRRTLEYNTFDVRHVMNITDVGHLSDDGDAGEDKMVKSAREKGMTINEIADMYTQAFFEDTDALNILRPNISCKATDHVNDMIALIERLEAKGHTYTAGGNVYFSIDTFPRYGELARLKVEDLQAGARIAVDPNKRNPMDFVLWFTQSKFANQAMVWPSPWGVGYPGWHIECSAMSIKYLGETFDLHCGGIDHIPVHHTNEIAQSEAATGKRWVNYWIHGEFLINETGKLSKSKGEFLTLSYLQERGYHPLDYRYFCLGGHYRSQLVFSWQALDSAKSARERLVKQVLALKGEAARPAETLGEVARGYIEAFVGHLNNDLNTPRALATIWTLLKDGEVAADEKLALLYEADKILGLRLEDVKEEVVAIPDEVQELVNRRMEAKAAKEWAKADELRGIVEEMGYSLKDTNEGTIVTKICNQDGR